MMDVWLVAEPGLKRLPVFSTNIPTRSGPLSPPLTEVVSPSDAYARDSETSRENHKFVSGILVSPKQSLATISIWRRRTGANVSSTSR